MAYNPELARTPEGAMVPALFPGEVMLLHRDDVDFEITDLRMSGMDMDKWSERGRLFLSNVRMVMVANRDGGAMKAFDAPLAYITGEKFNQPIFGCNNLSGNCFTVASGGPMGTQPPHRFAIYFRQGGCGTLLPMFFGALTEMRNAVRGGTAGPASGAGAGGGGHRAPPPPIPFGGGGGGHQAAFIDPNDPTKIYLPAEQPPTSSRAPEQLYPL